MFFICFCPQEIVASTNRARKVVQAVREFKKIHPTEPGADRALLHKSVQNKVMTWICAVIVRSLSVVDGGRLEFEHGSTCHENISDSF